MKKLQNIKVLYVEDSKLQRMTVEKLLKDKVQKLYFANDGKEGVRCFRQYQPDIVISDVDMPVMDGLAMSQIIKKIDPDHIIVLLTSFDSAYTLKTAINIGIDSFITKPLEEEYFLKTMESLAQIVINRRDSKKLKKLQVQKEKVDLVLKLIKEISHHWRQPLSSISTIASADIVKKDAGIATVDDLAKDMELIFENVEQLALILKKLENLDIDKYNLSDIEDIIKISNPIYK